MPADYVPPPVAGAVPDNSGDLSLTASTSGYRSKTCTWYAGRPSRSTRT
jgi:hypothetical protein